MTRIDVSVWSMIALLVMWLEGAPSWALVLAVLVVGGWQTR